MRHVVLAFALLGSIGPAAVGILWMANHEKNKATAEANRRKLEDPNEQLAMLLTVAFEPEKKKDVREIVDKHNEQVYEIVYLRGRTYPFLLGAAVLAVLAGIVAELRHGFSAALLLLGAVVAPAIVYPVTLCFNFLLIPAIPLAMLVTIFRWYSKAAPERIPPVRRRREEEAERRGGPARRRRPPEAGE
jgi:hypothetical protein